MSNYNDRVRVYALVERAFFATPWAKRTTAMPGTLSQEIATLPSPAHRELAAEYWEQLCDTYLPERLI